MSQCYCFVIVLSELKQLFVCIFRDSVVCLLVHAQTWISQAVLTTTLWAVDLSQELWRAGSDCHYRRGDKLEELVFIKFYFYQWQFPKCARRSRAFWNKGEKTAVIQDCFLSKRQSLEPAANWFLGCATLSNQILARPCYLRPLLLPEPSQCSLGNGQAARSTPVSSSDQVRSQALLSLLLWVCTCPRSSRMISQN